MHRLRRARELLQARDPRLEVGVFVVVREAVVAGVGAALPGPGVASVELDVRGVGGGDRQRRERAVEARRHVDADVRELVLGEERHGRIALLPRDPVAMAELDRHRHVAAPAAQPLEVLERTRARREVRGEREDDRAELAELTHRGDRREEPVERGVERARGQVFGIELASLAQRGRERVAHLGRDRLDGRGVVREQAVSPDVEDHVLGRAVDPWPDDPFRERLARRVDLHHTRVLRTLEDVVGRDDGADLDLGVDLLAGGARPSTRRGGATAATAAIGTTPAGTIGWTHGGEANGCRRIRRSTSGGTMALRVVGAGLGRTGTLSLQTALQQLLGGPLLPHGRDVRPPRRHPGVARRGERRPARLVAVPGRLRRHRRLAGVRVLA